MSSPKEIFLAALEIPPAERDAFLDQNCAKDPGLRQRVEGLLQAHDATSSFLGPHVDVESIDDPRIEAATLLPQVSDQSEPIATSVEQPGMRIGPYKLLQRIGAGGMGSVWMAEQQEPVRRKVAIKMIRAGMHSAQVIARFEAERQALALMEHPNIARIFDGGATPAGQPYVVMELVKGAPITRYCDEQRLRPEERLELFIQVCQAVQHAHQKGIIHRDLKPSNVLVALFDGRPVAKVIDFGVAKATGQDLTEKTMFTEFGAVVGTLQYMSPEQADLNNQDIDTRSDIYSLGVLLYELLTGTTPLDMQRLRGAAFVAMLMAIKEEEPPRPSTRLSTSSATAPTVSAQRRMDPARLARLLRGELDCIVMKALEKDRARRYETANGLARDIQRYLADEPVEARPPTLHYRLGKVLRRNKAAVIAAGLVLLALVAGIAATSWQAVRASKAESSAVLERDYATQARDEEAKARRAAELAGVEARDARGNEEVARRAAEADRDAKRLALARAEGLRLSAEAAAARHFDPGLALNLAVDAVRRVPNHLTYRSLYEAVGSCAELRTLRDERNVQSARFSPDGRSILTLTETEPFSEHKGKGVARVWDAATGRLLSSWIGYELAPTTAEFSPDSRKVAAAVNGHSYLRTRDGAKPDLFVFTDRVGYVWDVATGKDLLHLRGHTNRVVSIRFSLDGQRLVTAGYDGTARVWDAASGAEQLVLKGHKQSLQQALFSPDSKQVLSLTLNQSRTSTTDEEYAQIKQQRAGAFIDPGVIQREGVLSTGGTHDSGGNLFGEEKLARIWDAQTGKEVAALTKKRPAPTTYGHRWQPTCAAFSPDGTKIAMGFALYGAAIWATAKGGDEQVALTGHQSEITALAFSPKGERLATASLDLTARVYEVSTGKEQLVLRGHESPLTSVCFSPDGKWLLTASRDRTARVWDAATGQELQALRGHTAFVTSAAFSPDGTQIVTAGDQTARLWRASPPPELALVLRGHEGALAALQFSPDGKQLLTASADQTARTWNLETGKEQLVFGKGWSLGEVRSASFSNDGRRIITASENSLVNVRGETPNLSAIHVWDVQKGDEVLSLNAHETAARTAGLSPDGATILTVSDGATKGRRGSGIVTSTFGQTDSGRANYVRIWDATRGQLISTLEKRCGKGFTPRFSPDAKLVLTTVEYEAAAHLLDAKTGKTVLVLSHPRGTVTDAAFSPDGKWIATAGDDKNVCIWDVAGGKVVKTIGGFEDKILVQFSPDGRRLLTLCKSQAAIWDAANGSRISQLVGHEAPINASVFSPDGSKVLTGSDDQTVVLWDATTGQMLSLYRGHPGPVRFVAFSPDGQRVATGSTDGVARVWPCELWPSILARLPRKLTPAEQQRYETKGP